MTGTSRWWQAIALAAITVIAALVATWLLKVRDTVPTAIPGLSAPIDTIRWETGITQHYTFNMESSMRMQAAADAAAQVIPVSLSGRLTLHTLESTPDSVLNGVQLSAIQSSIAGQNDLVAIEALQTAFRVRYENGAVPTTLEFPMSIDEESRSILASLLKTFQITFPESSGEQWTAAETNTSGNYSADYQRSGLDGVAKSKHSLSAHQGNPMLANASISSSETIRIDAKKNWIVLMTVDESVKSAGGDGPVIDIKNHATLELDRSVMATASSENWNFTATEAARQSVSEKTSVSETPGMSAGEARSQLLAELPRLDTATSGRTVHIHRLRDLLRIDAALPAKLVAEMATGDFTDRTRADLYLALELAGTPAAQAALTSIMSDISWSLKDGVRAIIALGGVANPDPDAVIALWETTETVDEQLASTALFALGSIGNTLHSADNPDYPILRDSLLGNAYGSAEPDQRADYISALGNTRDQALAGDIASMLGDANPTVRRAAALSLGQLGTTDTVATLIDTLAQENNGKVRSAIVDSLTQLPDTDNSNTSVIASAIQGEPDESARFAMAGYLGKHVTPDTNYESLLQDLIRKEPSRRVRQRLGETLASIKLQ